MKKRLIFKRELATGTFSVSNLLIVTRLSIIWYALIGLLQASIQEQIPALVKESTSREETMSFSFLKSLSKKGENPVIANRPFLINGERHLEVYLFYHGQAKDVRWVGDFNGWRITGKGYELGRQISKGFWVLNHRFPVDARIDYRLLIDGTLILDPLNKETQLGGFGLNSVIKMPEYEGGYKKNSNSRVFSKKNKGKWSKKHAITNNLFHISYTAYLPQNYLPNRPYQIVFFTDGKDFSHPEMGNASLQIDRMIEDKTIPPIVSIFIDVKDPFKRYDLREVAFKDKNGDFSKFFIDQVVPSVTRRYTSEQKDLRLHLVGVSLAANFVASVQARYPQVFPRVCLLSPAFQSDSPSKFLGLLQDYNRLKRDSFLRTFISVGNYHDGKKTTEQLKQTLEENKLEYTYNLENQGHSWGFWRLQLKPCLYDLLRK